MQCAAAWGPCQGNLASAPKNTSQLATLHLSLAASAVAAGWTDVLGRAGNVSRHLVLEKGKVTQPGHARRPAVGRSAPQLQPAKPARPSATASSCFPQLISRDLNYFCTQHYLQPLTANRHQNPRFPLSIRFGMSFGGFCNT